MTTTYSLSLDFWRTRRGLRTFIIHTIICLPGKKTCLNTLQPPKQQLRDVGERTQFITNHRGSMLKPLFFSPVQIRDTKTTKIVFENTPSFYLYVHGFVARPKAQQIDCVHSEALAHKHRNVLAEVAHASAEAMDQQNRRSIFWPWIQQKQMFDRIRAPNYTMISILQYLLFNTTRKVNST